MPILPYCRFSIMSAVILLWTSAYADMPLSQYEEFKKLPPFKDYVAGVGRGIFWANIVMKTEGGPSLFCMPNKLALDEGLIYSLLDQEIRSPSSGSRYELTTPLELILVRSFIARFPCK